MVTTPLASLFTHTSPPLFGVTLISWCIANSNLFFKVEVSGKTVVMVETNSVCTGDPKFTMDRDAVAKIAQQCNMYAPGSSMFNCSLNIP